MDPNYKKTFVTTTVLVSAIIAGSATAEAALGDQPLAPGKRHQDVIELQNILKEKGFFTYHTATGYYGTITEKAVKDFQLNQGLAATGIADEKTQIALIKKQVSSQLDAIPLQSPVAPPQSPQTTTRAQLQPQSQQSSVTLSVGSRGQAVVEVQKLLDEAKLFDYHTHTGYYGEVTAKGVREFQQKANMTITGKADASTIAALKDYLQKQQQEQSEPQQKHSIGTSPNSKSAVEQAAPKPILQQVAPLTQTSSIVHQAAPVQPIAPNQQIELSQTQPTEPLKSAASFLLEAGSNGGAVRELQHQLVALDLLKSQQVNGYFGPATKEAVKQFQQEQGLIADGLATTKTIQKIVEATTRQLLPAITLPSETRESFHIMNLIADASEQIGTPYLWAGTTSAGFDCSGFLQYIFQKNSIELPRTVAQMWEVGEVVTEIKVGDIVFFETYMPGPSHAGVYIGNNQFIHSGSTAGVSISNLESNYYSTRYLGAKRYH